MGTQRGNRSEQNRQITATWDSLPIKAFISALEFVDFIFFFDTLLFKLQRADFTFTQQK